MYPIPTLSRNHSGHARSYGYGVLFLPWGWSWEILGAPARRTFCESKIGSELALVGHSDDASSRALGPPRSGDAASSIRARERQAALHAASLQAEHFLSAYVVPGSM